MVYIVVIDLPMGVDRFSPDDRRPTDWTGKPIPELGGIQVTFVDDEFTVITPDGIHASNDHDQLGSVSDRMSTAEARAAAAEARAARLEEQLRQLGVNPEA